MKERNLAFLKELAVLCKKYDVDNIYSDGDIKIELNCTEDTFETLVFNRMVKDNEGRIIFEDAAEVDDVYIDFKEGEEE